MNSNRNVKRLITLVNKTFLFDNITATVGGLYFTGTIDFSGYSSWISGSWVMTVSDVYFNEYNKQATTRSIAELRLRNDRLKNCVNKL